MKQATIGQLLRNYRKRYALSQGEVAKMINMNRVSYSLIEEDKRSTLRPNTIKCIANLLGKEVEEITKLFKE